MRGKSLLIIAVVGMLCVVGLLPAAAQTTEPVTVPEVMQGEQLLHENFNSAKAWEKYTSDNGIDYRVDGGVYAMRTPKSMGNSFAWAVNATQHSDVIIEATFIQRAVNPKSNFGLMCRTDTTGIGYYFIITGEGEGYIAKGLADKTENLTGMLPSDAIATGTDANIVRAICVGNYLALYVNGTLVAQTNDSDYASGVAGLAGTSGGDRDGDVTVDDLDIFQATASTSVDNQPTVEPTQTGEVTPIAFTVGKLLTQETFRTSSVWDNFTTSASVKFGVGSGGYNMHVPAVKSTSFFWGITTDTTLQTDTVIEATLKQKTDNPGGQYGVICRSDDQGHGYYFVVGMDGYAFIAKATPGNINDITTELSTSAIRLGTETNKVRAVCVGDYLALYVNDEFVLDANDSDYSSGVTGLTAATNTDQDVDVVVSSVTVNEAIATNAESTEPTTQAANLPAVDGVTLGKVLQTETFDDPNAWEVYDSTDNKSHFHAQDGVYLATTTKEKTYIRGENTRVDSNYVTTVDATLEDGPANSMVGIMCRVSTDGNGNGYHFAIRNDGFYTIERFDQVNSDAIILVDWKKSSAIKAGNQTNTLTVACVEDLLAFYVNGVKLVETHDSTYADGLTALTIAEMNPGMVHASFDNLSLIDASLD